MVEIFDDIVAVGFDLDGTLYKTTPAMNNRVRTRIAEKILEKLPALESVERSRNFFETHYKELSSGTRVLEEVGYENYREVMDECLATANIIDLIKPDMELNNILEDIHSGYITYLLTTVDEAERVAFVLQVNPLRVRGLAEVEEALKKLEKIGINPELFHVKTFSDTPYIGHKHDGTAFQYIIGATSISADDHVYIGDKLNSDILPAKKLGMRTVAVWSEIPEADYSIKNIHDISRLR